MQTIDADEIRSLLSPATLAQSIARFLIEEAGGAVWPTRTRVPCPGEGSLLLMAAVGLRHAVTKIVTVHPGNAGCGVPVVQADVLLLEAATGRRLALMDGEVLTELRTAAVSLLAARLLARRAGGRLVVIGAGRQARAHLEAFVQGLEVERVDVVSRDGARAEALAGLGRRLGVPAEAGTRLAAVLGRADLVVCATSSARPVLEGPLAPDAFVAAVGAFRPDMAEVAPQLVRGCAVAVDDLAGARAEAGDLIQAGIDWSGVIDLRAAVGGARPAGFGERPALFKSVGCAGWDLVAAQEVWARRAGTP